MVFTNVFSDVVFRLLHILFIYFDNVSVAARTVCKDVYDYIHIINI